QAATFPCEITPRRLAFGDTAGWQLALPGCRAAFTFSALLALPEMVQSGVIGTILGTILNVAAIVLGGLAGLMIRKQPSASTQSFFKVALGVATVYFGLRLTWLGINGSFGQSLKQIGIILLSLSLGNLLGKLLHLQKASNRIGNLTRDRMTCATPQN